MIDPVVICSFARTPMGAMQGDLSGVTSTALGAAAVAAAVARAGVAGDQVERIYMGCVLAAGLGQSPARQAAQVHRTRARGSSQARATPTRHPKNAQDTSP